jgi:glycosyltransferase involved in cell wall biosynthesis
VANSLQRPRSFVKDTILEWAWAFPDPAIAWFSSAVQHGAAMEQHAVPDAVVATGGPWTSFLVGRALAKRFDRPLIVDYRDPWTCNPFYSFTANFLTRKAQRLERSICLEASRIITNTDELRERLCIEHPEIKHKSLMIPNGFDPGTIALSPGQAAVSKAVDVQGYELYHFGSVYGKRTPRILLQAILELQREIALTPEQLRLRFVGAWESTDQDCNRFAVELESRGFLRREPPVSHENCLHQMRDAHVLLVVQPESPLQVPGKIYEYIAMGRPLLLIGGEGATANLVQRYHLGASCPNSIGEVKRLLRGIVEGTETIPAPDQAQVKRFDYRSLTGELAVVLDAVVTG